MYGMNGKKKEKQLGGIDIGVMPPQNNYVSPTQRLQNRQNKPVKNNTARIFLSATGADNSVLAGYLPSHVY